MKRAADIFDDPILRKRPRAKCGGIPVTVCIAARCGSTIICASDRMITAGDVQFEPDRPKLIPFTNSIYVMTAGDASFLNEVLSSLFRIVSQRVADVPNEWISVPWIVDEYVRLFNEVRRRHAEAAILGPLGLTMTSFLANQLTMSPEIVRRLTAELLDYAVPSCAVLFAGLDPGGTYLVTVYGTEVRHHETIGFASVGMGSRHADSQFMLARHAWNDPVSDGLLRTYIAKRRSEVAPGVGSDTDMVIIGPNLGQSVVVSDEIRAHLEAEYQRIITTEREATEIARTEIAGFMSQLEGAPRVASEQGDLSEAVPVTPPGTASDAEPPA